MKKKSYRDNCFGIRNVIDKTTGTRRFLGILLLTLIPGLRLAGNIPVAQDTNDANTPFSDDFNPFEVEVGPTDGPAPTIQFDTREHDFGRIAPGSQQEYRFRFTNAGQAPLIIKKTVRSTCGCAVPTLDKTEYLPGESGEVKVVYRAHATPGRVSKRLYVQSNDPNEPMAALTVTVNVVPPVKSTPETLILRLQDGIVTCPPITLESTDGRPFAITGFLATQDAMLYVTDPNRRATTITFQPVLNPEKNDPPLRGVLLVDLSHPDFKQIKIPFQTLPEFQIVPASVVFFNVEPGHSYERRFSVINNYGNAFAITDIQCTSPTVRIEPTSPADLATEAEQHIFSLKVVPASGDPLPPSVNEIITVILPDQRRLQVLIRLVYRSK